MKIQSTKLVQGDKYLTVEMVISDMSDLAMASQSIAFVLDIPGDQKRQPLEVIQLEALVTARSAIAKQIQAVQYILDQAH